MAGMNTASEKPEFSRRYAVLGFPVTHSLSPAIHNAAYRLLGMEHSYSAIDATPDSLDEIFRKMRTGWLDGVNVTMPCKTAAAGYMDILSDEAAFLGAVNTVVVRNNKLYGHSTDGQGFCGALKKSGGSTSGKRIVFFGCGGAARAAAAECAACSAAGITFLCREKGLSAAEDFSASLSRKYSIPSYVIPLEDKKIIRDAISRCDVLVNATPVGMTSCGSLLPDVSWLEPRTMVCDMIYSPRRTLLMQQAESAGCTVMGGLEMLLQQAACSFRLMTGADMPVDAVRREVFGQ